MEASAAAWKVPLPHGRLDGATSDGRWPRVTHNLEHPFLQAAAFTFVRPTDVTSAGRPSRPVPCHASLEVHPLTHPTHSLAGEPNKEEKKLKKAVARDVEQVESDRALRAASQPPTLPQGLPGSELGYLPAQPKSVCRISRERPSTVHKMWMCGFLRAGLA